MNNGRDNMMQSRNNEITRKRTKEFLLGWIWGVLLIIEWSLSFFFHSSDVIDILYWTGWIIFAMAMVLVFMPIIIFPRKGGIPKGKSFTETTILVDTGIYGIVRHPQYLGGGLFMLSFILIAQHWLIALFGISAMILLYINTIQEDRFLIEKFGADYERYMKEIGRAHV